MRAPGAVALAVLLPSLAGAWPVGLDSIAGARVVADAQGNVVAAFRGPRRGIVEHATVVRFGRSGRTRWRRHVDERRHEVDVADLALAGGDDPVVAGNVEESQALVVRYAARDGKPRWRSLVAGTEALYNRANAVVVDAADDVVVADTLKNAPGLAQYGDFAVVKLGGASGAERWRFLLSSPAEPPAEADAFAVAVDPAGDVVAGGTDYPPASLSQPFAPIVKLAGATGTLVWRRDLPLMSNVRAIAIDAAGDVYVTAPAVAGGGPVFAVVKLAGATGDVLWIAEPNPAVRGAYQQASKVAVDAAGAVYASGTTADASGAEFFSVVRLDPGTGGVAWRYDTTGTARAGGAGQLRLAAHDLVVAGGAISNAGSCYDALVVALDARTGAPAWSRTFDGTYTSRFGCEGGSDGGGPGPIPDNDGVDALAVDPRGAVFAALTLVDRGGPYGSTAIGSIRRLTPR